MTQHGGRRPGAGRKPGRVSAAKRDIAERAKTHGDAALNALVSIMGDDEAPHSARVSAANAILDRGYGKPRQAVEVSGPAGGPVTIAAERLSTGALRELLGAMGGETPDSDGG